MLLDEQTLILAVMFSTRALQYALLSLLVVIGTYKYLNGNATSLKLVMRRHICCKA